MFALLLHARGGTGGANNKLPLRFGYLGFSNQSASIIQS